MIDAYLRGTAELDDRAVHLLLAGNAGHADIPLTSPGSGVLAMILTLVGQQVGYPVPVGGAGSHLVGDLASANCLIVVPEDVTSVEAGESVDVLMLEESR